LCLSTIESVPPESFTRGPSRGGSPTATPSACTTHTRPDCARLDDDGVRAEIIEPARRLSAELGIASLAFSYPFGRRCSAAHERMLVQAGIMYSKALLGFPGSRLA
jgi:hypothetical protein